MCATYLYGEYKFEPTQLSQPVLLIGSLPAGDGDGSLPAGGVASHSGVENTAVKETQRCGRHSGVGETEV